MSMTEDQMQWLMSEKHAGRLTCQQCGRAILAHERTTSAGWPDGTFRVFCLSCADRMTPIGVDHYELLDTETGESERIEPDEPW
jgi:hypothetical protein